MVTWSLLPFAFYANVMLHLSIDNRKPLSAAYVLSTFSIFGWVVRCVFLRATNLFILPKTSTSRPVNFLVSLGRPDDG